MLTGRCIVPRRRRGVLKCSCMVAALRNERHSLSQSSQSSAACSAVPHIAYELGATFASASIFLEAHGGRRFADLLGPLQVRDPLAGLARFSRRRPSTRPHPRDAQHLRRAAHASPILNPLRAPP